MNKFGASGPFFFTPSALADARNLFPGEGDILGALLAASTGARPSHRKPNGVDVFRCPNRRAPLSRCTLLVGEATEGRLRPVLAVGPPHGDFEWAKVKKDLKPGESFSWWRVEEGDFVYPREEGPREEIECTSPHALVRAVHEWAESRGWSRRQVAIALGYRGASDWSNLVRGRYEPKNWKETLEGFAARHGIRYAADTVKRKRNPHPAKVTRIRRYQATSPPEHGLAWQLRVLRQGLGLSRQAIADRFGLDASKLVDWELGFQEPPQSLSSVIQRLAEIAELAKAEQRMARAEANQSQTEFAAEIGVHRVTLSRWEREELARIKQAMKEVFGQ